MDQALVDRIVSAVLYEGYILYPYRPSLKNRQRWTFGGLHPPAYSQAHPGADAAMMQAQCLLSGGPDAQLDVTVRFLHLLMRSVGRIDPPLTRPPDREPAFQPVASLQVDGRSYQAWQEAVERRVSPETVELGQLCAHPQRIFFAFGESRSVELLRDGQGGIPGLLVRCQQAIEGEIELSAEAVQEDLFRLTVRILNHTPLPDAADASRDEALMHSLVSTHAILAVRGGQFVSAIDPPPPLQAIARECRNIGCFPVLVGQEGQTDGMLCSPIILYDHPQVAAESPGDLYDCTEIDEILTLRVMTLTDAEKQEMLAADPHAAALLDRTESLLPEQLLKLHGALRNLRPVTGGPP